MQMDLHGQRFKQNSSGTFWRTISLSAPVVICRP